MGPRAAGARVNVQRILIRCLPSLGASFLIVLLVWARWQRQAPSEACRCGDRMANDLKPLGFSVMQLIQWPMVRRCSYQTCGPAKTESRRRSAWTRSSPRFARSSAVTRARSLVSAALACTHHALCARPRRRSPPSAHHTQRDAQACTRHVPCLSCLITRSPSDACNKALCRHA